MHCVKEAINPIDVPVSEIEPQTFFILGGSLFMRTTATAFAKNKPICCVSFPMLDRQQLPKGTIVRRVEVFVTYKELEQDNLEQDE
jgi:hypothetical protein